MGKVYTLVRFSKTGNIYYGSYDTIGQRRATISVLQKKLMMRRMIFTTLLLFGERKKKEMVVMLTPTSVLLALSQTAMMLKFMYRVCI